MRWTLADQDGGLTLSVTNKERLANEPDPLPLPVTPLGPGRFMVFVDGSPMEISHVRLRPGRDYLYGGRLLRRVVPTPPN